MKRIYEAAAYAPPAACWWDSTEPPPDWPVCTADMACDVAVIGGGFTGLSAALHLAEAGADVALFEAETPGFGASGRNGGFCCLGGAKASRNQLVRAFGTTGLAEWNATEKAAIATVDGLIDRFALRVDRHSNGETLLAHSPRAWDTLRRDADTTAAAYGVTPRVTPRPELATAGLNGPFHGALTVPLGFALNPRKFLNGLARAAQDAGARLYSQSPVRGIGGADGVWRLRMVRGTVTARQIVLATNGYSSEDVPRWLRGRYLPVQSSVLVTRPLTEAEQQAQGWTSSQMAYDTRFLLHYFRKMPDNRFLFGMRGGLRATPRADARTLDQLHRDFRAMFPAWGNVAVTHRWQGLVCLMPGLTPFCGEVPGMPGVYAGMGFHGNGVAMGTHTGRLLADLVQGHGQSIPRVIRPVPRRMPLGRYRRALLWPAYTVAKWLDR